MQGSGIVGQRQAQVQPVESLADFFRTSIGAAIARQRVAVDPQAAHYVVNLMTLFARSDALYEFNGGSYGLRPLALMLADAADADTPEERNYRLQRIGDVALFVSGFFADSLRTAAVDLDYYIRMGGSAYGSLSDEVRGSARRRAFAGVFRELARKFAVLVDVLHDVRDGAGSDIDLLRTYEIWLKTGSRRAARLLRERDVIPFRTGGGLREH
ncbi:MAG TPA: hypothetical protein VFY03_01500 [Woeseiaceae bacterium]|nr:hypothetical protein [Woeseiaceae bacterium]